MLLSRFEITESLGAGERFHRARRSRDGRDVLLRTVGSAEPSRSAMLFEREHEITRELGLDGVLATLDLIDDAAGPTLVFEGVAGMPLDDVLRRRREPLPIGVVLDLGSSLARTLGALHRHDFVHRDLRPANIFFDEIGINVYLTGLGRASRVPQETWRIQAPQQLEGDPAYLAPEATGRLNRQLDYRADLYSLGVVLFEALTGRRPFDGPDPAALVHAHIASQAPDPLALRPDLPPMLAEILRKLLAKTAEDRYQSALGLAHDLDRCRADLRAHGTVHPFEPGERDVAERFELPQTLIGREEELRWLEQALATTVEGAMVVRLVAGYSGVGKTALIEEIRLSVLRRRGMFAGGTFDPGAEASPHLGVLAALRGLVAQKLGDPPEHVEAWKRCLVAELGPSLGVLTADIPELVHLVGEPPEVPAIEPAKARNRFHACVGRFLDTLAGEAAGEAAGEVERAPLVLFLDDLQWIDGASLELLESLLNAVKGGFLLLGAFRDNEVDEDHRLRLATARLARRGLDVDTLRLPPLGESTVARLVAETLRLTETEVAPLAELVYRKTAGNPFFARTFLHTLYRRRLLRFEGGAAARWTFDLDAIATLGATENVVELVAGQLTELPPEARRTLAAASVLGKEVDPTILAALVEADRTTEAGREDGAGKQVDAILVDACRRGLMVKSGARYVFAHDRVREGAYALLDEAARAELHLRIGRLLRDRPITGSSFSDSTAGTASHIFEVADHLRHAAHLVNDPDEHRGLAQILAYAGYRARSSGAFTAAFEYLGQALDMLTRSEQGGGDPWGDDYALVRDLHVETAEMASLAGDFATAERLAGTLIENARDLLDAVPAYETRIYGLHAQREVEAAIRLSLEVLARLGMEISIEPEAGDLKAAVDAAETAVEGVLASVAERGIDALPVLQDPRLLTISRLLMRVALMSAWTRMPLLRFCICRLVGLTAGQGLGPVAPIAYVLMIEVRCGELADFAGGRRIGELGLELARRPEMQGHQAICGLLFDTLLGGRILHPAVFTERCAEHLRPIRDAGDFYSAAACCFQYSTAGLLSGIDLRQAEAAAVEARDKAAGFGQVMLTHAIEGVVRWIGVLIGRETLDREAAPHIPPELAESLHGRLIGPEMLVHCIFRRRSSALSAARESLALRSGAVPFFPLDFYRCLILLDHAPETPELAECEARLELLARAAPEVHGHKLDMVRGLRLRAEEAIEKALASFDRAIDGARKCGSSSEEALAAELAAELCLRQAERDRTREPELRRHAAVYLRSAVAAYERWGARAKVDRLLEAHPGLAAPSAASISLDTSSLEQARIALAGELDLARLLRRLMTLLLRNAGAQRGFLLHDEGGRMVVDARGTEHETHLPVDLELEACAELATAVVRFVARTEETVVLGDARRDPRFASDPYIEHAQPRSVLCFPLLHQGRQVEIVYLENAHSPDVFSAERASAVRLLAAHAAAALRNARLHQTLKEEVETRRRTEAELAALKDRLEAENVYLREQIRSDFGEIVGSSETMQKALYKVEQVAATDATVLVLGETGTGKELVARALHRLSGRRDGPLVKVNCAALPSTLIESELFGHEKGSFTGAQSRRAGRFELADGGTLFLDEVGDLPLELQAKLLRVLQDGEFERLGGVETLRVDVRIIAATNRDLEEAMEEGTFRSDLYYRLNVFPVELPPLRQRQGDIPLLVRHFVERKRARLGRSVDKIPQQAMQRLVAYGWPGNVRELENVVERALILSPGETLRVEDAFGSGKAPAAAGSERLIDLEREHIEKVLESCEWKIKGEGNAAERLGLAPPTLRHRMKKLGIERPSG